MGLLNEVVFDAFELFEHFINEKKKVILFYSFHQKSVSLEMMNGLNIQSLGPK